MSYRLIRRRKLRKIVTYPVLIVATFLAVFPIYWVFISSVKPAKDVFSIPPKWTFKPTLQNYEALLIGVSPEIFEGATGAQKLIPKSLQIRSRFPHYYMNSLIISTLTIIGSISCASLAAYACVRFNFLGKNILLLGSLLTRMIPPVAILIPIRILFRRFGLLDTHIGMAFVYLSFNLPFALWMLRGFFSQTSASLEEAAMIDGCSRMGAFVRIALPLAAPGMAATAVLNFIYSWNEFLFALILTSKTAKTVSPAITEFITDKAILWGRLYAGATLIIIVPLIFALLVQKYLVQGLTFGAVK